jgi:hypothetical protein
MARIPAAVYRAASLLRNWRPIKFQCRWMPIRFRGQRNPDSPGAWQRFKTWLEGIAG